MTTEHDNHLPLFGVGPAYVICIAALTMTGIILSLKGLIPIFYVAGAAVPLRVAGVALVAGGVALWLAAVIGSRIDDNIVANQLVTTGVYAVVRNPIYSAFALACTGALLIHGNLALLVLPLVYWALMTLLMRATEEKWLLKQYGDEYVAYCGRVNRCIPWFPRR